MSASIERRRRIHDLIVEELREDGVLEDTDLVTYWMSLVHVHSLDEDGEDSLGPVYKVLSDPGPTSSQALGLIEWQRLWMQANVNAIVLGAHDHDEDDE